METTTTQPNRYAGHCQRCNRKLKPGQGTWSRQDGVRHLEGECDTTTKSYAKYEAYLKHLEHNRKCAENHKIYTEAGFFNSRFWGGTSWIQHRSGVSITYGTRQGPYVDGRQTYVYTGYDLSYQGKMVTIPSVPYPTSEEFPYWYEMMAELHRREVAVWLEAINNWQQ